MINPNNKVASAKWRAKNPDAVKEIRRRRRPEMQAYLKKYYADNKTIIKLKAEAYRIKRLYGITVEEYKARLAKQNGLCALCFKPFKVFPDDYVPTRSDLKDLPFYDHCHETEKFRGFLHLKCNVLLGAVQDDCELLFAAIAYLQKNKSDSVSTDSIEIKK